MSTTYVLVLVLLQVGIAFSEDDVKCYVCFQQSSDTCSTSESEFCYGQQCATVYTGGSMKSVRMGCTIDMEKTGCFVDNTGDISIRKCYCSSDWCNNGSFKGSSNGSFNLKSLIDPMLIIVMCIFLSGTFVFMQ